MLIDVWQLIYLTVILGFGFLILYIRRKAKGSKSFYKIVLVISGIFLFLLFEGKLDLFIIDNLVDILLIILAFELSMRLTSENIKGHDSIKKFLLMLLLNITVTSIVTSLILHIEILNAIIFAILLTAIEYFLVDELREEGDVANPFILLFAFGLVFFLSLKGSAYNNVIEFIQYISIGIGTGIFIAIILFKILKPNKITYVHELALLCSAYLTYLLTEYIGGFGLLSVVILGAWFGNSYVKKKSEMNTFSPFIFKSIELLVLVMTGFILSFVFDTVLLWKSIIIFIVYVILRFIVISITNNNYSLKNKVLLTFAPKGIVFAASLLVLTSRNLIMNDLTIVMTYILIISLICSWILEYIEKEKIKRLDKIINSIRQIKYGRKRDLKKHPK